MKRLLAALMVLTLLTAATTSCQPQAAQDKVIKIGVVGALTGDFAMVGKSQLTGAQMKANEINAQEGDITIEVLSEDDASDCDQSVNATTKLITRENVHAVLGAINSPCALAMVPITEENQTPQFTFGVGTAITEQGSDWIYRVALKCSDQARQLAQFAHNELGHDNFAVLYSDDEYGASCASGFRSSLEEMGLEPAAYESFPRGDREFSGQLTTVQNSEATALYVTGDVTGAALIAQQAEDFGLDLQLLGDTGIATPQFAELAGDAAVGTVVVEPFTPVDPDPEVQEWVAAYEEEFDRQPDGWVAEMYDTVGLIYEGVSQADQNGEIDWSSPDSVRQAIHTYAENLSPEDPYAGILPEIYFDEQGDCYFPLYKVEWQEGGEKEILSQ